MRTVVTFIPESDNDLEHPLCGMWVLAPVPDRPDTSAPESSGPDLAEAD